MNLGRINIWNFIKGSLYTIYLAPTYINILTVFAISNIHDVSWGSRPAVQDKSKNNEFEKTEKKRAILYRNFRSNFLVGWIILNIVIGNLVTYSARNQEQYLIQTASIFLGWILGIKLLFCMIFIFASWISDKRISKATSGFFANVDLVNKDWNDNQWKFKVVYKRKNPHEQSFIPIGEEVSAHQFVTSSVDYSQMEKKVVDSGINLTRINNLIKKYQEDEENKREQAAQRISQERVGQIPQVSNTIHDSSSKFNSQFKSI